MGKRTPRVEFGGNSLVTDVKVALVTVGFESEDIWPSFFASLAASTLTPSLVVVVENSEVVPGNLENLYPNGLTVLHRPDNPGYGGGINWGVSHVPEDCSVIVMCNPDIEFQPEALEVLVNTLMADERVGIAGPAIVNPDGSLYPSARAFPGIRVGVGHALLGEIWKKNPWTRRYLGVYETHDNRIVDWLSGSCLVIKREAFVEVGGFDTDYFMFLEDVDLCFRLKRAGWRSLYVPAASITHAGGHSTKKRMADMVRVHHESARKFLFRLYDKPVYWPLRQVLRLGLKIRSYIAPVKYKNQPESR
jgi:N-acetylglucosaminyl-diphospho-decaprenol L-rhamnosyltransferase